MELTQPNMHVLSDDDETQMLFVQQAQNESLRYYSKVEMQEILHSDEDDPIATRPRAELKIGDKLPEKQQEEVNIMQWLIEQCGLQASDL